MEFYLFLHRRISEFFFIVNILLDKEGALSEGEKSEIKFKISDFYCIFEEFQQYVEGFSSSF